MKHRVSIIAVSAILILGLAYGFSTAADFPKRPISLINPAAPGGNNDALGRIFASLAEKYLGQPMVVVNKPGAKGIIGAVAVAKAKPDGYTLLVDGTMRVSQMEYDKALGKKHPISRQDYVTIGSLMKGPLLLIVPYDSPWQTLGDLVKALKAKPGEYAFCSSGVYGPSHLPMALIMNAADLKARHVAYHGGGPCIAALLGGHYHFSMQFPSTSISLARAKKVRLLAVSGEKRLKFLPDVPTCKEQGVDVAMSLWLGVLAPAKTPKDRVAKLREVFKQVVNDEKFTEMVENLGVEADTMIGDELTAYWEEEGEMFANLFKKLVEEGKIEK